MKAMVLAAGAGTRLDPLTLQLPKPLVPVVNIPVIDHTLNLLKRHDFDNVWANLYHLPDLMAKHFEKNNLPLKVNYLIEDELSGDAGGVRACRKNLDDSTLLVIMGDLLTNADLSYVIGQHKKNNSLATIALKAVEDVSQFGVAVIDKNGWIKEFQEKPQPQEAKSNLASTGIYVLEPAVFDHMPIGGKYGFGKQLFPDLVNKGLPVLGVEINSYWSDVGTFEQYRRANFDALDRKIELALPGTYKKLANAEVWLGQNTVIDPKAILQGKILIGNNVTIKENANLSGHIILGDNCVIESGAEIQDSIIWSASNIGTKAKITNTIIGLNSQVPASGELKVPVFVS